MSNYQCHCSSKLYRKQNFQVQKENVNFVVQTAKVRGTSYPKSSGVAARGVSQVMIEISRDGWVLLSVTIPDNGEIICR